MGIYTGGRGVEFFASCYDISSCTPRPPRKKPHRSLWLKQYNTASDKQRLKNIFAARYRIGLQGTLVNPERGRCPAVTQCRFIVPAHRHPQGSRESLVRPLVIISWVNFSPRFMICINMLYRDNQSSLDFRTSGDQVDFQSFFSRFPTHYSLPLMIVFKKSTRSSLR